VSENIDDEDLYDPRAKIVDSTTGEVKPVLRDELQGLDEFIQQWQHNVEIPHEMKFSGWQMADDEHIAGTGIPAYRLVRKTIRTVVFPQVTMTFPNLLIRLANGAVTWGEPRFNGTLLGRAFGTYLLPEWGAVEIDGDNAKYTGRPNVNVNIEGHQESTPDTNYVELLYHLPDGHGQEYGEMVAAGRAGLAPLTAMLDFMFGERLLGPVLTEEVGEVFNDWHWNRLFGGRTVSMESQARFEMVDGRAFCDHVWKAIERELDLDPVKQTRLRIASQWYWSADAEPDAVQRYISYWLCVEALEVKGKSTDIAPVKKSVAKLLGVDQSLVSDGVGRLYGIRGSLVHGSIRETPPGALDRVRALACALLEMHSLGVVTDARLESLRAAVLAPRA
jgi:hypothetical protein